MAKKILVVDDNPPSLKIITMMLEQDGHLIITAKDGEEGVKKVISEKPDIVLIDTVLPGINGFEVCRQIRESQGSDHPKIIIMTGAVDAIDAVKARRMGADDYAAKTFDLEDLKTAVKNLV